MQPKAIGTTPPQPISQSEQAKTQRLKFILLRNVALSLVAYAFGLSIGYILVFANLTPYSYTPLNTIAIALIIFHVIAFADIWRRPVIMKSQSTPVLWLLLGIWFVVYFTWVIFLGEYRGMGYVQSMMTLGFGFSYATARESIYAIIVVAVLHFSAAMVGIFIFDQPGHISSECLYLISFLASAGFTGYMFHRLFKLLRKTAATDALTGLMNRRMMNLELEAKWQESQRHKVPNCLIMIDLDFFKNINDGFGHEAGDETLKHVAETITAQLRGNDRIGRWGGEEFLVLLSHVDIDTAMRVANRLLCELKENPMPYKDKKITVSFSAGLVQLMNTNSPMAAINKADTLLYRAKKEGRSRICS